MTFLGLSLAVGISSSLAAYSCPKAQTFATQQDKALKEFLLKFGVDFSQGYPHLSLLRKPINGFRLVSERAKFDQGAVYEFSTHTDNSSSLHRQPRPDRIKIHYSNLENIFLPRTVLELKNQDASGGRYTVTDVGYKLLDKDLPILENAFERGLKEHHDRNLQVEYHPALFRAEAYLSLLHKWMSLTVTDIYENRKGYLSPSDLYHLRESDIDSQANDNYFVLQKAAEHSLENTTYDKFRENTLAIIRLVRYGKGTFFVPDKLNTSINNVGLPILKRYMGTPIGNMLKQTFGDLAFFGRKSIAEISRFVRTQDFPEDLLNSLIKSTFEAAINGPEPTDIILISVDAKTRRLFSKYRFKDLVALTDPTIETPEYVMYIDTKSPEFQLTLQELREKSSNVAEIKNQRLDSHIPTSKYSPPPGWYKGSEQEKVQQTTAKRHEVLLSRSASQKPSLNWQQRQFSNQPFTATEALPKILEALQDDSFAETAARVYRQLPMEIKSNLFERSLWRSYAFETQVIAVMSKISSDSRNLIISDRAKFFIENLRQPVVNASFDVYSAGAIPKDAHQIYDNIVLDLSDFQRLPKHEFISLLSGLKAKLGPQGQIQVIFHSADGENRASAIRKELQYFAANVASANSSLSAAELALVVASHLAFLKNSLEYNYKDMPSIIELIGLRGGGSTSLVSTTGSLTILTIRP